MKYAVIGAGVLGLTAALRLAERGHRVVLLERDQVPGGLASGFEVAPGIWLERFYHHLFRTDHAMVGLIREMGLLNRLQWHRPVSTVMLNGVPRQLDSARTLLRLPDLSAVDRVRMAGAIGALRLLPTPRPIEGATADAWMRWGCGESGHAKVWRPLLQAKFGDDYDQVSMAWMWARIHDRTPQLGYLDGGFHQLHEALAGAVLRSAGEIIYGAHVRGVLPHGGGLKVTWQDANGVATDTFDRVISTLPRAATTQLAPVRRSMVNPRPATHFLALQPRSAHCLVLALDRPLTGIYWIGSADRDWPFLAVVEHTAMLPTTQYAGHHLVYLGAYRDRHDPFPGFPPDQQLAEADDLLRTLNPAFKPSWVRKLWSFTAPDAQPIVDTGYRRRTPGFRTDLPGFYKASMFQVYPHDRGQNYSLELAARLVKFLHRDIA